MFIPLTLVSLSLVATCSAFTTPVVVLKHVVSYKWMTFRTLCFACVVGATAYAAERVDLVSHSLQVFGINASWIATKMIQIQSFRNFPHKEFVRYSVGQKGAATSFASYPPVSIVESLCPFPAIIRWIDLKLLRSGRTAIGKAA
jgi:hypothetical protein